MKLTFLGTGTSQGVPVIGCHCEVCQSLDFRDKRLRTSLHLEKDGKSIVIDTGPDFRMQMLRESVPRLDAVVYTHEHKDHTAGLDDIRPFNFSQQTDIPLYGSPRVLNQIKTEFSYVFAKNKYPGIPRVLINEIGNLPFDVMGIRFIPIEVMHHKLPVFGFRIADFTYITDANYIAPEEIDKIIGTKVLVVNALQIQPHISHFTLEEALAFIEKIGPETAYLTHISHRMGMHQRIQEELPKNVNLAYDGLKIHS
ncbi:phosphoribosyl 1,2-cyclic phosphate phosphodiesterase [Cyclobacterium xiamenense]|uniref:Phosphoribosyl 1,2-cyclic phosphate phosphodiesterase n=1 Tax=Cyclobacterium xiamenense TaxID=1297121 RepID=A0A1H6YW65_9BACT|nr:MBL fold metallo-hydrolase [Cyclobacterium xiamenense]SEJ41025.1 phosphoribosyl 1,2-cyclic phosphate phosphodiesterase [Cyclobacterium xiamenense]